MQVYLVGGAVRDHLLGHPYHEKDYVVVGATPEQLLDQAINLLVKIFLYFYIHKPKMNMPLRVPNVNRVSAIMVFNFLPIQTSHLKKI
jgi:hypothetical protein